MVNLGGLLAIFIIILVIGIVGVTWSEAPEQLKSFASALMVGVEE